MSPNFFGTIFFLGALQGLFLTLLIFQKRRHLFANYFLSALTLLFFLVQLCSFLCITELHLTAPYSDIVYYSIRTNLLIFPLYYLYTRYLTLRSETLQKKDLLHFLPFLLFKSYNFSLENSTLDYAISNGLLMIQGGVYLSLAFYRLRCHAANIKQAFSSLEKIRLNWLQYLNYMLIVLLIIFILEARYGQPIPPIHCFKFYLTHSSVTILVYVMGYIGFFKSTIFSDPELTASIHQTLQLTPTRQLLQEKTAKRYKKSGLSPDTAHQYLRQLQEFMEAHKPYRDNELTLNQLAKMLDISPHHLSEIINIHLEQNFFDFINQYRLEEIKRELCNPEKAHLTLLAIAMEAGFNSKTTFNTFFKKHTRMSPSAYRKRLQNPQKTLQR